MTVENSRDAAIAFDFIHLVEQMGREYVLTRSARKHLVDTKRNLRKWLNRPADPNHIGVSRFAWGEYDSYTELIEFPEEFTMDRAKECFEDNYRMVCLPSQYDCTGQLFTSSAKFFMRRGHVFCYHGVCMDV